MLFSEPKIPQSSRALRVGAPHDTVSVLFSEPKIPQFDKDADPTLNVIVSVLFSEPKIPQLSSKTKVLPAKTVSVLFSEPKIPQCRRVWCYWSTAIRFSALQRAENSSIKCLRQRRAADRKFQCSSASRKFLNRRPAADQKPRPASFSALQRAENSSIKDGRCMSDLIACFSALQRAENSSIWSGATDGDCEASFSALQRAENSSMFQWRLMNSPSSGFSALQRAENSSIIRSSGGSAARSRFQCSSASRKFLNTPRPRRDLAYKKAVSVLFSEPKIPQSLRDAAHDLTLQGFSALQRAENSSIVIPACLRRTTAVVSVLFSEPKIPQSSRWW